MGKKSLPENVKLLHDFDRLASKKLIYVYQVLIPENFPTREEPVSNNTLV
jgi:hypothetical protein